MGDEGGNAMRELALLLLVLRAVSSGRAARAEDGCHATGKTSGEVAVCGDTREVDRQQLEDAASASAAPRRPSSRASLPGDGLASGARPIGPADRENVPRGRSY
jgi:hypothetical protein